MLTVDVIPGLRLDESLYEAAADGVLAHAPDVAPLTWEQFTDPMAWTLVPDDCGDGYKAELELLKTAVRTLKINVWMLPDLRGGQKSVPHSHPWAFRSHILTGGYTEDRYLPVGGTVHSSLGIHHQQDTVNDIPREVYHEVTEIHDPCRTLTLMVCERGTPGAWGYLDTDTGEHRRAEPDPDFLAKLAQLNPHRQ